MSHHYVEFRDVTFRYPDGTRALNSVSFRITHGESVGIVGANGSGKSTLLMHMNGYLMPSSGSVTIGDVLLQKGTARDIRKRVGLVFQNPDDQLFMPTVFDDVAFGPLNLGLEEAAVRKRVDEALDKVNGFPLKDKPPHRLSGGQKSAVAIASVIAMEPDILVMDEPAANLDPRARRSLIRLLRTFSHTKIIASHDLDLILDVCSRCIVIRDGTVADDGPADKILSDKRLLEENRLELPLSLQRHHHEHEHVHCHGTETHAHLHGHEHEHSSGNDSGAGHAGSGGDLVRDHHHGAADHEHEP